MNKKNLIIIQISIFPVIFNYCDDLLNLIEGFNPPAKVDFTICAI